VPAGAKSYPDGSPFVLFASDVSADDVRMWRKVFNPWYWLLALLVAVLLYLGIIGVALSSGGMRPPG
jgi:hypothetical protein